ncbi:MAG: type II toxin-antitoxin system prevent-host-death family antitoxin [Pseudomonadota bacterium]|nr:type II toxin-antitoxin system prevent-host-death family antitoxin [Pseudomonadota bacterium]
MIKTFGIAHAKAKFSEVVNSAEHKAERVIIEKRQKPVAVLIGYEDYKLFESLEDIYHAQLLKNALTEEQFFSLDEAIKKLGIEL